MPKHVVIKPYSLGLGLGQTKFVPLSTNFDAGGIHRLNSAAQIVRRWNVELKYMGLN